jgi:hypothetical protein
MVKSILGNITENTNAVKVPLWSVFIQNTEMVSDELKNSELWPRRSSHNHQFYKTVFTDLI